MNEVIKFESIDGQTFDTAKQAEDWDRFVIFKKWYESDNQLTGISAAGAYRWLENNQAEVMLFYSTGAGDHGK